jgi:DinB family
MKMVLTKEELVSSLKQEVRILLHLASKINPAKLDYRPTAKQRSTLELLQYMAIMGPTQIALIKAGTFNRPTLSAAWGPAEAAAKAMNFDQAVSAIQELSDEYPRLLSEWTEADFRREIDMFGRASTRGRQLVNLVLNGHAAYRTQLFCYLKSCGREELNTMNLWAGVDAPSQASTA